MKLNTQPYKGTRDFYPEDFRLRQYIFDIWRKVSRSFGYEEYDGPILEPIDLYTAKTSEEIVNEQSYSFVDRGGRNVIMRPEMTPTVSRMVAAKRQELAYPLRLFSIPNCFRYERPQKGRLREFWQYNADIFGVEGTEADIEIITLADSIMKAFGAKPDQYEIQISSRKILQDITDELKINDDKKKKVVSLIDKKEKIEEKEWEELFYEVLDKDRADALLAFLRDETVPKNASIVIDELKTRGITNVRFNKYLARGFDYYTDVVFEIFDTDPDFKRSLFGGGRYDGLVGDFGVDPVPTAGFAIGDAPMMVFLEKNNLLPNIRTEIDLYVAVIGDCASGAQAIASRLREQGLNVAVDLSQRKLEKQIKTADKKGIQYMLFIGNKELSNAKYKFKNINNGEEKIVEEKDIFNEIKS